MRNSLTILFAPVDAIGHVNACIGVAQGLLERGHRIVFAINEQWRGKLNAYGFEEELISDPDSDPDIDPAQHWTQVMLDLGTLMALPPVEKLKLFGDKFLIDLVNKNKNSDTYLNEILNRCKPHVIVIDNVFIPPSILKSGIPWVLSWSCNPLRLHETDSLPPAGFGLSSVGNSKEWKELTELRFESEVKSVRLYNEWIVAHGLSSIPENKIVTKSPYLSIYDFPEEIDYTDDLPPNIKRFDSFIRSEKTSQFEIPDKLKNKSGKLVYLSMGSMGSGDVNLMKRLISILSKSAHRFIVSKGQFHDQYELPHNMWGQKTLPQTKVLPVVDLVITHGGNNTVTETFYFGKPMIIMPLFGDQFDNAQRVHETGYGVRLEPYNCSETELLEAVENLLNDSKLALKLNKMTKRIQSSKSVEKVAEAIEKLAQNN